MYIKAGKKRTSNYRDEERKHIFKILLKKKRIVYFRETYIWNVFGHWLRTIDFLADWLIKSYNLVRINNIAF